MHAIQQLLLNHEQQRKVQVISTGLNLLETVLSLKKYVPAPLNLYSRTEIYEIMQCPCDKFS